NVTIKVLKIVGNVFFYLVIIFLLIFSIANIKVKKESDVPNVFGRGFIAVIRDSMEGNEEDSINEGDLIFVKMLDEKGIANLKIGDIVTFFDWNIMALNTHRIKEIVIENDEVVRVYTQGDKAALSAEYVIDGNNSGKQYETVLVDDLKAKQTSTWANVGDTLVFIQTPVGFGLVVIVPIILLVVYQAVILVRTILAINRNKLEEKHALDKEDTLKQLESDKEKMRAELLEELKKEQKEKE
ncbi:MAG TPA: signal peptidase I, partial [Acholeplasmataceae bacterium]|nr:signal peptidase I [Acholeplasmataceae bacterium]